jgi:hypothetical protein
MGVKEDEGNPMTMVGAWGGESNSCPACIDDAILDIGVAAGEDIGGCRVATLGGGLRLRDVEGAGRAGQDAALSPQAIKGGTEAAAA